MTSVLFFPSPQAALGTTVPQHLCRILALGVSVGIAAFGRQKERHGRRSKAPLDLQRKRGEIRGFLRVFRGNGEFVEKVTVSCGPSWK